MASNGELPEEEIRYGGAANDGEGGDDSEAKRKAAEREQKKAEVRKRLEEAGAKKKKKKGFLTPERKKKLRKLLMQKAAENLKQQQMQSEQERQKVLSSRIVAIPDVDSIENKDQLEKMYNDLFARMIKLEEEKYDINFQVSQKDSEINELTIAVNDLRGKFVKPALKKVSKYDNKFKKLADAPTGQKEDFRAKLKVVKKENVIEDLVQKKAKSDKPEWSKKGGAKPSEAGAPASPVKKAQDDKPPAEEPPAEEEPAEEEEGEEEEGEEEEEE
jgi:hypothetical protein